VPSLKKTIILCVLVFAVGSFLEGILYSTPARAEVIFSEDFESSPPHPLQDSSSSTEVIATAVWNNVPPTGWTIDNTQMGTNGVLEFTGWVFLDLTWWEDTAPGQSRSQFDSERTSGALGFGTAAVADGDEWHDPSISGTFMNTWISTPAIDTSGHVNLELSFDSSWQMEVTQEASLEVSYDGGPKQLLFHWDCVPTSPDFHDTNFNEHITIPLNNADSIVITFGYYNADNDWWWAFDNVQVSQVSEISIMDDLIGYWPYEGNTVDDSGLGNDGIAVNNPPYVTGKFGLALDFNGSNQYVTMDAVADDFSDNDVTMAGWLKTTETGEADWYSNNSINGQFLLCNLAGEPIMYESGWKIYAGVTINDDAWHHVVITRENMLVKLYVDGVQRGSTYTSTIDFISTDRWSIAQEWDDVASDFYEGIVDDVALWDRALSPTEISWLWNNGDGNPIRLGYAIITESGGKTEVTEGGAADNYTIKLDSVPTDPVMITATPSDAQIDLGSGAGTAVTLTFTVATWNTPQTVTVTAYDDDVYEGKSAHKTDITHSATSADDNYNGDTYATVEVNVYDNEQTCGDWGYLPTDLNTDCYVDLKDFARFAIRWLDTVE